MLAFKLEFRHIWTNLQKQKSGGADASLALQI